MSDEGSAGIFLELHAAVVPVSDMERAKSFYDGLLGLSVEQEVPGLCVFATGGPTRICLYVPEPGTERPGYPDQGSFPNFRASDIQSVHRHLTARDVPCSDIQGGGGVSWFRFEDPDGNRIDVCEYGPDWLA